MIRVIVVRKIASTYFSFSLPSLELVPGFYARYYNKMTDKIYCNKVRILFLIVHSSVSWSGCIVRFI